MIHRLSLIFLLIFNLNYAQDISGLWMHDSAGTDPTGYGEMYGIMYLNIDDSNNVTGFTYDYQVGDWCSFYLEGTYDPEENRLKIVNTEKIRKPFSHARCTYKLEYETNGEDEFLVGRARQKGIHGFLLSFGGALSINLNYRKIHPENFEEIKGYDILKPYIDILQDNSEKETIVENTIEDIQINENTIDENQIVESTIDENRIKASKEDEEISAFISDKATRKNELIKSHYVKSKKITIEVLDNIRQDGDRISIFLNDVVVVYNIEITKEPKQIEMTLLAEDGINRIYFVANNSGDLPPNTATIRYTIDGITYEEELFTNLRLNKYLELSFD